MHQIASQRIFISKHFRGGMSPYPARKPSSFGDSGTLSNDKSLIQPCLLLWRRGEFRHVSDFLKGVFWNNIVTKNRIMWISRCWNKILPSKSSRRELEFPPSQNMQMDVIKRRTAMLTIIDYHTIPFLVNTVLSCYFLCNNHTVTEKVQKKKT